MDIEREIFLFRGFFSTLSHTMIHVFFDVSAFTSFFSFFFFFVITISFSSPFNLQRFMISFRAIK